MNTLKIFSILIFAVFCFAISLIIANRMLIRKKPEALPYERLIGTASSFIGISIILNLVFQKINYLYDLIDQYGVDFYKLFEIGNANYGFSPEMLKVSTIYLALAFVWVVICSGISNMLARRFATSEDREHFILRGIIFICLAVAFYPVLNFILDNFYIILNKPVIH